MPSATCEAVSLDPANKLAGCCDKGLNIDLQKSSIRSVGVIGDGTSDKALKDTVCYSAGLDGGWRINKNAMIAAFKYLAHGLGALPANPSARDLDNARICVDQRDRAQVLMTRLQDARSATMKAIMKVR